MDEYFRVNIKNHKVLNKKILFLEYLKENFSPEEDVLKEMISFYRKNLETDKFIVIFDLRNIKKFNKQKVWKGAGDLKKFEDFFITHIHEAFIIIDNKLIIETVNIIIKVVGTNIKTRLVKNVNEALNKLN